MVIANFCGRRELEHYGGDAHRVRPWGGLCVEQNLPVLTSIGLHTPVTLSGPPKVTYPRNFSIGACISALMEPPCPFARWLGEGDRR